MKDKALKSRWVWNVTFSHLRVHLRVPLSTWGDVIGQVLMILIVADLGNQADI